MDKIYSEIVLGGQWNRGHFREVPSPFVIDYFKKEVGTAFHSLFSFNDSVREHVLKKGTVKGFRGPVYAPYLVWDIDVKYEKDPREALAQAWISVNYLCQRLGGDYGVPKETLTVWFSGKK